MCRTNWDGITEVSEEATTGAEQTEGDKEHAGDGKSTRVTAELEKEGISLRGKDPARLQEGKSVEE